MATRRLRPVHPGDILFHDFMQPLNLSAYKLAKELGVTAPSVNEIVRRRRAITAEMALRLSGYFGTSAQLWLNLQSQYDLETANRRIGKTLKRVIHPIPRPDLPDPPLAGSRYSAPRLCGILEGCQCRVPHGSLIRGPVLTKVG
jgi:antitoxin HigA-1